jgi:hypothetical protein
MERGSSKHGPRQDEALAEELAGQLGPGGSNREEWADPEPPADDDPPARTDLPAGETATGGDQDGELQRLQHDMGVANDWLPGDGRA